MSNRVNLKRGYRIKQLNKRSRESCSAALDSPYNQVGSVTHVDSMNRHLRLLPESCIVVPTTNAIRKGTTDMTAVFQCNNSAPDVHTQRVSKNNANPFPCTHWNLDDSKCGRIMHRVDLRCTHGCTTVFSTIEDIEKHYSDTK